jgi:hypothetical protein
MTNEAAQVGAESQLNKKVVVLDACPEGKTIVRGLLVSGQKSDFVMSPSDTIEKLVETVYNDWPTGKCVLC